ncbi:hypothetical protein E5288_WYG008130 [Bos mutus]|uniref:Uncharacterized protein n=1 Tax=Bos mutus TaxID=72004 RepID=A0A6B0RUW7_9CETA|nr:hypothetical protein [Bos mutus]
MPMAALVPVTEEPLIWGREESQSQLQPRILRLVPDKALPKSRKTSSLDLVLTVQVHPDEDDLGMEDQVLYIWHLFSDSILSAPERHRLPSYHRPWDTGLRILLH